MNKCFFLTKGSKRPVSKQLYSSILLDKLAVNESMIISVTDILLKAMDQMTTCNVKRAGHSDNPEKNQLIQLCSSSFTQCISAFFGSLLQFTALNFLVFIHSALIPTSFF